MEKPEHELYNELKKLLDPHKTSLEALTRKKDVNLADVEKAKDNFVALLASKFAAEPGWEKKGSLKRLHASYDAVAPDITKWIAGKNASAGFNAIKDDLADVQVRIATAEKKKDWPEVLRLVDEFRAKRAHHFPEGGSWTKIGEHKRYNDTFKGYAETLEKRCASGVASQGVDVARQAEDQKRKAYQAVLSSWRSLESRIREINVAKRRIAERSIIAGLLDECEKLMPQLQGNDASNASNFIKYHREMMDKPPSPERERDTTSSWPDLCGFAGGHDVFVLVSANSIYRLDEAGAYEQVGDYAAWSEVRGVAVFAATGRAYIVSRASIYSMDPKSGQYEQIDEYGGWTDCHGACVAGDSLFVSNQHSLYRVSPKEGNSEAFAGYGDWSGVVAMAAVGSLLFVVCSEKLYRIDSKSGKYEVLEGRWQDIKGAVGFHDHLFLISGDTLYKIDAHTGKYESLVGGWAEGTFLAATSNKLFGISRTYLYNIDPVTGKDQRI
jgi:hypothetical protein